MIEEFGGRIRVEESGGSGSASDHSMSNYIEFYASKKNTLCSADFKLLKSYFHRTPYCRNSLSDCEFIARYLNT